MHNSVLATVLICAATVPAGAQPDMPDRPFAPTENECGAAGFQGLVGQSGELAEMLVLDIPKRVIGHNSAVTMDYRPDRINFELDEDGVIAVVRCG